MQTTLLESVHPSGHHVLPPIPTPPGTFDMTETRALADVIDTSTAHPARRYNYWLGGKDNFAADRESGDEIARVFPRIRSAAVHNRAFLGRAVRFLVGDVGVRQFLDIGTGLPTADNTHDVAQRIAPESRIVYVDNDPLVLTHARALLTSAPQGRTAYVEADARDPAAILAAKEMGLFDLGKPVALLLVAVLHFLDDDQAAINTVSSLMAPLPAGSYLVVSHATDELLHPGERESVRKAFEKEAFALRSKKKIASFARGLEMVDPGVVPVQDWRPEDDGQDRDDNLGAFAFVACKTG